MLFQITCKNLRCSTFDSTLFGYVLFMQVPKIVQDRVKLWMQYTWEQQKSFDENNVLSFLPTKMRTDLALQVKVHNKSHN